MASVFLTFRLSPCQVIGNIAEKLFFLKFWAKKSLFANKIFSNNSNPFFSFYPLPFRKYTPEAGTLFPTIGGRLQNDPSDLAFWVFMPLYNPFPLSEGWMTDFQQPEYNKSNGMPLLRLVEKKKKTVICASFVLLLSLSQPSLLGSKLPSYEQGEAHIPRSWWFWPIASEDLRPARSHEGAWKWVFSVLPTAWAQILSQWSIWMTTALANTSLTALGEILSQRHPAKLTHRHSNVQIFLLLSC